MHQGGVKEHGKGRAAGGSQVERRDAEHALLMVCCFYLCRMFLLLPLLAVVCPLPFHWSNIYACRTGGSPRD